MSRLRSAPSLVGMAGFSLLMLGSAMVICVAMQASASAQAATGPYELYCPGTPVGNVVLNDVSTSGTITPPAPTSGQQFNLTGYQTVVSLPASLASAAAAVSSTLQGSATAQIDATGATPATLAVGPLDFNVPFPSPIPDTGVSLSLPSSPETVGPFTSTSNQITMQEDSSASLSLEVAGSALALTCTAYPNDSVTPSGITTSTPTAAPISPVIAVAGESPTTTTTTGATTTTSGATTSTVAPSTTTTEGGPPASLTGAYELYCPGTPVGNVALNDAETMATLNPVAPTAGQSFSLTGYQTTVNLPASLASAAAAVSSSLAGSATAQIDAAGATPSTTPVGPFTFSTPFPSPIPDAGVTLQLPSTPETVPGFSATSGQITIQEDSAASLSLSVAGNNLTLTCTAYPNNSVASGIVTTAPTASPIAPVIAIAGGGSTTSTTAPPVTTTSTTPITTTSTTAPTTTTTSAPTTTTTSATTTTTPSSTTTTSPSTMDTASYTDPRPCSPSVNSGVCISQVSATYRSGTITLAMTVGRATDPTTDSNWTTANPSSDVTWTIAVNGESADSFFASGSTSGPPPTFQGEVDDSQSGNAVCDATSGVKVAFNLSDNAYSVAFPATCIDSPKSISVFASYDYTADLSYDSPDQTASESFCCSVTEGSATPTSTTTTTTTTTTKPHTTPGSSGPTAGVVSAPSGELAFTGSGPGLETITLAGSACMLLGLLLLVLADVPRRMMGRLGYLGAGPARDRAILRARVTGKAMRRDIAYGTGWFLGR
jgi:hypothetical protein